MRLTEKRLAEGGAFIYESDLKEAYICFTRTLIKHSNYPHEKRVKYIGMRITKVSFINQNEES